MLCQKDRGKKEKGSQNEAKHEGECSSRSSCKSNRILNSSMDNFMPAIKFLRFTQKQTSIHMIKPIAFSLAFLTSMLFSSSIFANPLVYDGKSGPGKGKHVVFLASDHEYRGEETCPALARILAKRYGFKCTVLFGLDDDGHIKPGSSKIPGTEVIKDADMLFFFIRG